MEVVLGDAPVSCENAGMFQRAFITSLLALCLAGCSSEAPAGDGDDPAMVERGGDPAARLVENVIVVSLDTLRADRLETYGYRRPTSPNLTALARRSVVFERAQAQAPQTAPSHASLFTSQHVGTHGIRNVHSGDFELYRVPDGLTMLAEVLQENNVETGGFVSGGNLTRKMGMDRGFDVWDETNEDVRGRIDALITWMLRPERERFFAFVHTYQVHAPYLPPREVYPQFVDEAYDGPLRARLERYLDLPPAQAWAGGVGPDYWEGMLSFTDGDVRFLSDLYDAEIAYLDQELRRLMEVLFGSELAGNTALIVLADHGEEFKDHGKFQHDQVFEELVHVPLMVRLPGPLERAGWKGRVGAPAELIDVAPTVAELMGLEVDAQMPWRGESLVPLLGPDRAAVSGDDRAQFAEMVVDPGPKLHRTVTWRGWKYIHVYQVNIDHTWEWLFDLGADPDEQRNLIASNDATAKAMLTALRERLDAYTLENQERAANAGPRGSVGVDDAMRKALEGLGYVGGAEGDEPEPGAGGEGDGR